VGIEPGFSVALRNTADILIMINAEEVSRERSRPDRGPYGTQYGHRDQRQQQRPYQQNREPPRQQSQQSTPGTQQPAPASQQKPASPPQQQKPEQKPSNPQQ
jgi:hypothetical protein